VAGAQTADPSASFTGPFGGAQSQSQMAQSFEVSISGSLNAIEAYVPSNSGPSCEFTWYLRDGTSFDPQNPDVGALPVIVSGTGMTDTPALIYDANPSTLLSGADIPVTAGDVLLLHIVRDCTFVWIAGAGSLAGDRFQFDGSTWSMSANTNLEFGRIITVTASETAVQGAAWSNVKRMYR
jgi:hypothetical protein